MSRNDNKRFWDRASGRYDAFMKGFALEYPVLIDKILEDLQPQQEVLEIACGTGLISIAVSGRVRQVHGTDFSPAMIHLAQEKAEGQKIPNITFSVQDGGSLSYGDQVFDACIVANALHIVPEPERILREARRVLRGDGLLIAPTYCHGESLKTRTLSILMGLTGFKAYHRFSVSSFPDFLERSGFRIVRQEVLHSGFPLVYCVARPKADG